MSDNLTFDDGEPITNNKLQSLYNAIKKLEGDVAKTTLVDATTNEQYTPLVYASKSKGVKIPAALAAAQSVDITFKGFESDNVIVTVTPLRSTSSLPVGALTVNVSDVSRSGARIHYSTTDKALGGKDVIFGFIAVEMRTSS